MPSVEDFEDNITVKKKTVKKPGNGKLFVQILFWIIFLCVCFSVSIASIRKTLNESNAIEKLSHMNAYRRESSYYDTELFFVHIEKDGSFVFRKFPSSARITGEGKYHDIAEAVLSGASTSALKEGFVSLFPKNTGLLGLSVSCGYAFVDVSSEFTETARLWGEEGVKAAAEQLTMSLNLIDSSIEHIVILIEGVETYCF